MRLSLTLGLALLLLAVPNVPASPCVAVTAKPDAWVRAKVDLLVSSARGAFESEKGKVRYERALDDIIGLMRRCQLERNEDFAGRYREFVDYVTVLSFDRLDDHELGFSVPDEQYFEETRNYVEIPEFLLTQKFFRAVSSYETLKQAKLLLQQLNTGRAANDQLIFFSYKSRHLGTPDNDNSFWRLLIVVPGKADQGIPEKWVQFGVPDPHARTPVRNVSIVSALARPDGTTDVYFKDNFRTYRRNGRVTIKGRWELGYGDDNCVQCHKSGILPIFPVAGSVSADEERTLEAANERFLNYARPRFDKYLDVAKFGPGLGSTSADELHKRFGSRFDESRVAKSMICASCHQPDRLGALNWPMDRIVISSFIKSGRMPLGYDLEAVERAALYRKLVQDYFAIEDANPGILKGWLLGKRRIAD